MSRSFHMHADVRGVLRRAVNIRQFDGMFKHPSGARSMTGEEAFDALCDLLKKGHECIPCGNCDNFDPTGEGCKGHPTTPQLRVVVGKNPCDCYGGACESPGLGSDQYCRADFATPRSVDGGPLEEADYQ